MTLGDLFEVTIIQCQITWKWYNIQLYLQWPTNRKLYMIYRTAPFSMILNDPYPQFYGHAIIQRWISQKRYDIQTTLKSIDYNVAMTFILNNNNNNNNNNNSFNEILLGTRPTQQYHFKWPCVILSDLAKYSMTRIIARSLRQLSYLFCTTSAFDPPIRRGPPSNIVVTFGM